MTENTVQVDVQVTPKDKLTPIKLSELMTFFKAGYGDRWISEEHFRGTVIKNSSRILELRIKRQLAAALSINVHRITDIAVGPNFRGQGLGVKLFKEAAKDDPAAWVTIGKDAIGMLSTVTDAFLNYLPVDQKEEVETLFKEINGVGDDFAVDVVEVDSPILTARLAQKGMEKEKFTAIHRPGSLHAPDYYQILFQNQSK